MITKTSTNQANDSQNRGIGGLPSASAQTPDTKPVSKIEQAIQSILEQRTYYPLYPGNTNLPIEWEQHSDLTFSSSGLPDIIISPSDMVLKAQVSLLNFIKFFLLEHRWMYLD